MPKFTRHQDHYSYEPKNIPRRYILRKGNNGNWMAESFLVKGGETKELRMKYSGIPLKRDASKLVDKWIDQGK